MHLYTKRSIHGPVLIPLSGVLLTLFILVVCRDTLNAQRHISKTDEITNIDSRRVLFLDDALTDSLTGDAVLRLHHPQEREVAFVHDAPWEGNTCGYHSIFKDGPLYRMYYRGSQITLTPDSLLDAHPFNMCYAESEDGIHWRKPNLGLYAFNGSKNNNIVLASGPVGGLELDLGDNAAFFKDGNPAAAPDARYKALVCSAKPRGLLAFKSADGIHWVPMSKKLIITDGAFDSQNVAFWDSERKEYRAYWRIFIDGIRGVRTAVSRDFLTWDKHEDLLYQDSSHEELYTNQIKPYDRAPYLFIGFPTRYVERGWSPSMRHLPQLPYRERRSGFSLRYGTALTEGLIMASTDGRVFKRWNEAFLRPGIERPGTWNYGHQYIGWSLVETPSALEGAPDELSLYATENSWTDNAPTSDLRRYTIRLDGFVSLHASLRGGSLLTKPIRFQGTQLSLNFSSSAAGGIWVEIQDEKGKPLPGFSAADCDVVFGDTVDRVVHWKNNPDLSRFAGKTVRLKFILEDADLYAFQFQP